jgi:hypothetical protein
MHGSDRCGRHVQPAHRRRDITGCDEVFPSGEPSEFCGPAGQDNYSWTGPGGFTASTQCTGPISAPGVYTLTVTDESGCECSSTRTLTVSNISCSISGDNEICEGEETELCGPEGVATYDWTGPGGFTADTRCITVGTDGIYELTIHNIQGCEASCEMELIVEVCVAACPRTVGFWGQQCLCAQGEGGRVKFSCSEMDAITDCIDDKSSFFNWSNDRASFCEIINPTGGMNQRKQAKRQFAGLLANVCVGELEIIANNGNVVSLPLDTPISGACEGLIDADNIGELITAVDGLLASLEGQPLNDAVKAAYGRIITCTDRINNGVGIPTGDPDECGSDDQFANDTQHDIDSGLGSSITDADLFKPIPNPFNQSSRMAYSVGGSAAAQVEISVFNTAGQRIRTLVNSVQPTGRYEATWDGRDEKGVVVPAGVYFYRALIGGQSTVSRVTFVK